MSRTEKLSFWLQAVLARSGLALFAALNLDTASSLGGFLARKIGPLTGAHKTATSNLKLAFPEKTETELETILAAMWDNIGRTIAEYPHLGRLAHDLDRVEIIDPHGAAKQFANDGIGGLLIGIHAGNWELNALPGLRAGLAARHFYRAPNNPYVDAMLGKFRAAMGQDSYLPKGAAGAKQATRLLKSGVHIGMLVDQKQDEGIAVRFFNRDAMTTTAPAMFGRRMNLPIAAARVRRLNGARFLIHIEPVQIARTANLQADVAATTGQISNLFESWIRENPEQWFWVHRRWPKVAG